MDFTKINKHFGIEIDGNKVIESEVTINSLEEFKEIYASGISDKQKEEFSKSLPPGDENTDFLQEVASHVYGQGELVTEKARNFVNNAFPVKGKIMTGADIVINEPITIGPAAAPYFINADTLTFDGGSITAITTALTIRANKLVIKQNPGDASSEPYHVAVLGQVGENGNPGANGKEYTSPAQHGHDISPPAPGFCGGAKDGGTGSNGLKGTNGDIGENGKNGNSNLPANIVINDVDEQSQADLVFFTQSGAGGKGGKGGSGGQGQTGGRGGNGCYAGCEGTNGGNGGNGGDGGTGGNGGDGGNGVDGNPITITFPAKCKELLKTLTKQALAGEGGSSGDAGQGGNGGDGGSGGKHHSDGANGGEGKFGSEGAKGNDGAYIGAPGNITFNYN